MALHRRPAPAEHGADHHRHADRLLRLRRLRGPQGLRPVAAARADRADQSDPRRDARGGLSCFSHPRGPSPRSHRPAGQQALALTQDRRRHRRSGAVRTHFGARRGRLGDHSRPCTPRGRTDHRQAGQGLVLRHRSRAHAALARGRQHRADRDYHGCLRSHHDARGQRPRLRVCVARRLLRRDRQKQSRPRDQDDQDAGRRVRHRLQFKSVDRCDRMSQKPAEPMALGIEPIAMSKRFGDFTALDDVSLKVAPGSFHALLGENGAGKSTLVKCIMGYYQPDAGEVVVGGRQRDIDNPRAAHALGLGMVYQHFTLVPAMTVAENLVLARDHLPAVVDWRSETKALEAFLERMPFRVPLAAKVSAISAGERQKCEILKQLYLRRRFLILDEPTSVLTPSEADEVLGMLRAMVVARELTVLMITHKFREVMAFADEVTILRRGKLAGHGRVAELTPDTMARTMIGAEELTVQPARTGEFGTPRLDIEELCALDDGGQPAVRDVALSIRGGEIVGVAGVSGNGQRQLIEVLAGQREAESGYIYLQGESYHATRQEMRRNHLSVLPEEPLKNACVARMSVADNLAFREFDRAPFATGGWWLNRSTFHEQALRKIERYKIKTRSDSTAIGELSGGNVQRTVLARELAGDVAILIAANPCFGLDFAAVAQIHAEIMDARNRGAAVLLVSEDLDELLELADRVVWTFTGSIVDEARP